MAGCGRFGFQQLSAGRDLDRLDDVADFQGHVQTQGFCRADRNVVAHQPLEPCCLIGDFVRADIQVRDTVDPFLVCDGVVGEAGVLVFDHHRHGGNHCAGGVRYRTREGSLSSLGIDGGPGKDQRDQQE